MILKLYRSYAQQFIAFDSVKQMDEHIQLFILRAGKLLHKNAKKILHLLVGHSTKYKGVSWLSIETISKTLSLHENTVKRAFKRLSELGIGRFEIVSVSGLELKYFVLNRFEFDENVVITQDETNHTATKDNGTFSTSETEEVRETINKDQVINNVNTDTDNLDATFTPQNVPRRFVEAVQPYINSAKVIYALWNKVLISYRKLSLKTSIDELMDTIINGIKQSIFMQKTGKLCKDLGAYFYGFMYRAFAIVKRQEVNITPSWFDGYISQN
ncbi:helix-turn-helix domain-containing protein [Ammoniphilus resinae]|uniref:DNA-binding Lrp family transcriptional regulator n=1 Tax=Ammoniphilus resinae TaxID=861532 RepID=A0ABS4GXP5_9BACL|nr:helix-turn-helix domain-containing protein [Ammoniphilus resinae]MBP1935042.1 DNA-binding Lrp family transcriptional regulator [Ammoniphilus resinae]